MPEPFLEHPRAFVESVARVLGGREVEHPKLNGFVSSRYDRFLNQLFATATVAPPEAAETLGGCPGFVWLAKQPPPGETGSEPSPNVVSSVAFAMTATTAGLARAPRRAADVDRVRSRADVDAWHGVYGEVFGSDDRGRGEWRAIHDALGPGGNDSLVLLLARVDGVAAATGGVYFAHDWAGLYWFTTHERMRGRGLASALVGAAHETARSRGIDRALLHATTMGRPVYANAGYQERGAFPMLLCR
jgi:GNAT superfamily N-acetyltransferase